MIRLLLLWSICCAAMAADTKPLVPNGTGGWMPIQTGQTLFAPLSSGAFSAIPAAAAGNVGQVYWATDTQTLYRSNGSAWIALATAATPGGSAGGDLGATYPNPTVQGLKGLAVPSVVTGAFLKLNGSGAWEFVSYGTGADQPVAGNDSRLSDSRAPTGAAAGDLGGTFPSPTVQGIKGLSLPSVVNNSFPKLTSGGAWEWVTYGTGPDTPAAGNDSRFTNSRAPSGAATGDLSGTYPAPSVSGLLGQPIGSATPTAGNLLIGQGSQWLSAGVSGDVALASSGATTLASVGSAGTYTQVTTDGKGRVTAGSSPSTLAGLGITNGMQNYGNTPGVLSGIFASRPGASIAGRVYISTDTGALYEDTGSAWTLLLPSLTGDVTTTGTAALLAASGVGAGTYGSATQCPVFTVDAKGRITGVTNTTITAGAFAGILPVANGGTGSDLSATGGTGRLLRQSTTGGAVTVSALGNSDLPTTGIGAGTYRSLTINAQGVATAGTNPTTLSGYGITDAVQNGGGAPVLFTGVDSAKPSAGTAGRLYFASDTGKIYIDSGSTWNLEFPALSGDITTTGTVATLATTGVSAGTFGTATQVPTITLDAKGRATAASLTSIAIPASAVTSGALAVARGGTATSSWTDGQVLVGRTSDGSAIPATITAGTGVSVTNGGGTITIATTAPNQTANTVFAGPTSGSPAAATFRALVAADIPGLPASQITSGLLSAANGGTGLNGSSAANGTLPIGNGSGFTLATLTAGSGVTITNSAGGISIAATGSGSGTVTSVAQTVPAFLSISGSPVTTSGTLALGLSGTALPVTSGGTGLNTDTAYAIFAGGTTSTGNHQQVSGLGTSGQVLTSNGAGALPTWQAGGSGSGTVTSVAATVPSLLSVSGSPITTSGTLALTYSGTALPVANGGTASTTALSGHSIMISNGSAIVQGTAGTATTVLHGNASGNPAYSAVDLTADVTNALPVANGGSGDTTHTAYSLLAGGTTGTGAVQSISGLGTSGQILVSNGAGALPTWQTGTGGGGVTSVNTLAGALTIAAGSNITVTPSGGNTLTIASTGGGGTDFTTQFSPCALDASTAPVTAAGLFTTGRGFYPTRIMNVVGARFYWSGSSASILVSLWNSGGTKVASGTASVTSTPGIFSVTFGSAYTILAADIGTVMVISMAESTGTTYQNGANPTLVPSSSFSPPGLLWSISLYGIGTDVLPVNSSTPGFYIIEPTFG